MYGEKILKSFNTILRDLLTMKNDEKIVSSKSTYNLPPTCKKNSTISSIERSLKFSKFKYLHYEKFL